MKRFVAARQESGVSAGFARKGCRWTPAAWAIACLLSFGGSLPGCTGDLAPDPTPGTDPAFGPATPSAGPDGPSAAGPGVSPGQPSLPGPGDPSQPVHCDAESVDSGAAPLRRLGRLEYALTLQQLFELGEPPDVSAVPAEAEQAGFTVHTALQSLSAQHLRAYLELATGLADDLLSDPVRSASVIGCQLEQASCLDDFVARFGELAFRRPLTIQERDGIAQAARDHALDQTDRYRYAIETLLVSPSFLYRSELGTGDQAGQALASLTGYELASRLAFALTGHGPDAALLAMAADGRLDTQAGRAEAVQRLAAEPGSRAFLGTFFSQWLGYERVKTPKTPPADWDDALLIDLRAETERVLARHAFGGPGFLDVLTTDQTALTPALAAFYGLPAPDADGWVKVPSDHPRAGAGLLGHASLLSQKTDGDRIATRGNWLRRTFLCRNLEIPEAIAATFGERLVGLTHTQIVRERNTDDACRGCHATIDPIGVGLDAFDATGRFDADYVVPDYGVAPGLPDAPDPAFASVAELAQKLQALPEVAGCLTERTFLFVHGREPERRDACTIEAARTAFVDSGYDFTALVDGLLSAPAFAYRRAPETAGGEP